MASAAESLAPHSELILLRPSSTVIEPALLEISTVHLAFVAVGLALEELLAVRLLATVLVPHAAAVALSRLTQD